MGVAMSIQKTITVEMEGKFYTAKYSLKNSEVTVIGRGHEETMPKLTTLLSGPARAKMMAKILLELLVEGKRVIPD
jgi:hypothetical protein